MVKTRYPDALAWGQANSAARGGVMTGAMTGSEEEMMQEEEAAM